MDISSTSGCSFFDQKSEFNFPAVNFTGASLEDGFTYRFSVTISISLPTNNASPQDVSLSAGITVLRGDGRTRLETGLAIPISLSVNARNRGKIEPDQELNLLGHISDDEFSKGFQTTNGVRISAVKEMSESIGPYCCCDAAGMPRSGSWL